MGLVCQDSDDLLPSVLDALNEVCFMLHLLQYGHISHFYFVEMHILDALI